jgi:rhodanese-related sulfurtransferase
MLWGFQRKEQQMSRFQNITADTLKQQLASAEPPIVIDVRSAEEYQQDGHIAGARLLPLPLLPLRRNEVPTDRPVVVVCRSGARSSSACEYLVNNGYTNISNLVGGMMGWEKAGFGKK